MDTLSAMAKAMANRDKELKVFDWDKAAQLIVEHQAKNASAGLAEDWEWTSGTILKDVEVVKDSYTFLSSTWATPELEIDGKTFPCYKMQSDVPDWDADTTWPESALNILADSGIFL